MAVLIFWYPLTHLTFASVVFFLTPLYEYNYIFWVRISFHELEAIKGRMRRKYLFPYLFPYLFIYLFIITHLFNLFIYLFIHLLIYLFIYLFIYIYFRKSICFTGEVASVACNEFITIYDRLRVYLSQKDISQTPILRLQRISYIMFRENGI